MRIKYLTCFIIVLFTQVILIFGLHGNFSSEQKGLNSSNSNIQTKQTISNIGNYENIKEGIKFHKKYEQYNKEEKFEQDYELIKKANRGKGANGGANVNSDPRRSRNSASSFLSRISTVCVSFVLILVLSFHAKFL